jgi:hypothetical protein
MMKKLLPLLFALIFSTNAFALYMGNPSEPNIIQSRIFFSEDAFMIVKVGYQGDYVLDRRLKTYGGTHGRIDSFNFYMNQGVFTLNFLERFEVFGSVGAMQTTLSHRPKFDHQRREYQSNDHTTWGVGGRAILFEWGKTAIGVEGGFQWANPHIKWDALNGTSFTTDAVMRYREWQVAAGVSHQIDIFIPYGGVKYSNVYALMSQLRPDLMLQHSSFKMRSRDYFGLVLGCTLSPSKIIDFTVEVRMIDEQAISLASNIQF